MITQPTNNQQSVHKNHLKQKGLATQGRGLDNEDLPCFEGKELFRLCMATRSKFRQSTSFATPSNALNLLLRAGDACGEEPNARLGTHHDLQPRPQFEFDISVSVVFIRFLGSKLVYSVAPEV